MLDRDQALQIVKDAYAARVRGDRDAVAGCWAEGARYQMAGDSRLIGLMATGEEPPMEVVGSLMDTYRFDELELLDAVVDGHSLALRWSVLATVEGKDPVRTQLCDFIKLDAEGRITSFVQFADTAMMRELAG